MISAAFYTHIFPRTSLCKLDMVNAHANVGDSLLIPIKFLTQTELQSRLAHLQTSIQEMEKGILGSCC